MCGQRHSTECILAAVGPEISDTDTAETVLEHRYNEHPVIMNMAQLLKYNARLCS